MISEIINIAVNILSVKKPTTQAATIINNIIINGIILDILVNNKCKDKFILLDNKNPCNFIGYMAFYLSYVVFNLFRSTFIG